MDFFTRVKNKLNRMRSDALIKKSSRSLKKYENKYAEAKRCFIVGNGPSLTAEDLDKLKGEITFASNRIFKIYPKTEWRPTFYCSQDTRLMNQIYREVNAQCKDSEKIFGIVRGRLYPYFGISASYIDLKLEDFGEEGPKFSNDISLCAYEGMTVTYLMMQIAAYMGFREIYLLGIDHNYGISNDGHFYESKKGESLNPPQLDKTTAAYRKAREYAESHGIKIFNSTRGGHLEVYERVDFDSLF